MVLRDGAFGRWLSHERVGLQLNTQKTKIMASGPITSWRIDGETVETVTDFILGDSNITADGACSCEIKRRLHLGKKVMTNLDSILKSRDVTLPTKGHLVKAMVFPVVMYGCESWTIKTAERQIDVFELWCWRRLLRVPWTARRSNQSILKEISPGCSLEVLMAEAETPILWPPDAKSWLIWKDTDAGKNWGQEEKGSTEDEMAGWHHQIDGRESKWTPGAGDGQGGLMCCNSWGRKESDTIEWLNWTELMQAQTKHDVKMQGADSYLPGKERGLKQILPSGPSEETNPVTTFILDFQCLKLWENELLLIRPSSLQYIAMAALANWHVIMETNLPDLVLLHY